MKLKNYTSGISVEKSISKIESLLADAGATAISKEYKDGRVQGIIFQIIVFGKPLLFKLPAKPEAVMRVMEKEMKRPQKGTAEKIREQANNVE